MECYSFRMQWAKNHPYAAVCAFAGMLLIIGAFIVERRTPASPGSLSVWGGAGTPLLNPTSYTPNAVLSDMRPQYSGTNIQPVYIPASATRTDNTGEVAESFNYNEFIAALAQPATAKTNTNGTADITGAYSFIPRGLIATSAPIKIRSDTQQKLFNYGNDIGSYIQTYEDSNRNAPLTLRDHAEDRQNPQKARSVKAIAEALRTVGTNMQSMEELPELARGAHALLAQNYVNVSEKLAVVADADSDPAFIDAINAYNAAADEFIKSYVSLATVFSLAGVTFSSQDPGNVFTFTAGGGF